MSRPLFVKTIDEEELTVLCLQYRIVAVNYIDVRLQEIFVDFSSVKLNATGMPSPTPTSVQSALDELFNEGSFYLRFEDIKAYRCGEYYYFQSGDRLIKYKPYTPSVLEDHIALRFE